MKAPQATMRIRGSTSSHQRPWASEAGIKREPPKADYAALGSRHRRWGPADYEPSQPKEAAGIAHVSKRRPRELLVTSFLRDDARTVDVAMHDRVVAHCWRLYSSG